jgi:hypothetical protein
MSELLCKSIESAYAVYTMVSTDTDGGGYEWYMYSCTRYVLNLVSAMSCLCTLVHVYVCTHLYTHTLGGTNFFSTCTIPSCCVTQP